MARLELHPDRLLPADPAVRSLARELFTAISDLPIVSPYSRVSAAWLADDLPWTDPSQALLLPAESLVRLLHAHGIPLADLGVGASLDPEAPRAAFTVACSYWEVLKGTPARLWLETELVEVFGVDLVPSAETADELYDAIAARLEDADLRPRALFERSGIQFLATLDDPCDDLAAHALLAEPCGGQVVPTFCSDPYLDPTDAGWRQQLDRLADATGNDTGALPGWVAAMADRRAFFKTHGAVAAGNAFPAGGIAPLADQEARRLYAAALAGRISPAEAGALHGHLLFEQARLAAEDGLVMVLHPAEDTWPGHDRGAAAAPPSRTGSVLAPVLAAFGNSAYFQLVVFADDASTAELTSLAGSHPGVFLGQPWQLFETPAAAQRWRGLVSESVGFGRTAGVIDHTAALGSIPARHDANRRLDAGHLAGLVATHRLTLDEAFDAATELVVGNPRKAFKL